MKKCFRCRPTCKRKSFVQMGIPIRTIRGCILSILIMVAFAVASFALEPVTALDDGFAIPSAATMTEAALAYPGSETFIRGPFATLAWSTPYGIQDLAVTTVAAGTHAGKTGIFIAYSGTGFDLYNDDQERFGISRSLGNHLSAGARITRNALRIKGFGGDAAWSADLGAVFHPSENIFLAASFEDMANAQLGESKEPLDGRSRLAASWRISGAATLLASVTKVRRFNPSLSGGVLMELSPSLIAGVMGANEPDRVEFLAAFSTIGLRFSYRGSFHRDLGFTHGFSLGWGTEIPSVNKAVP